jgi:hypothetical protein
MTSPNFFTHEFIAQANGVPFEDGTVILNSETPQEYAVNSGVSDHAAFVRQQLDNANESTDWEIVLADDTMLLLDYDTPYIPNQFLRTLAILNEAMGFLEQKWKAYKSRSGNTHVIVKLSQYLPVDQRIAWQAAFGSDLKREALHLLSNKRGDRNTMMLVMRKDRVAFYEDFIKLGRGE